MKYLFPNNKDEMQDLDTENYRKQLRVIKEV